MKTHSNLPLLILFVVIFLFATRSSSLAQSGPNGGKPIITFNTTGPISVETQSPPSFPGGEDKLNAFILNKIEEGENPIKLGRKT